jgi:uncharacterized protein YjbI with pentapeptide repeats
MRSANFSKANLENASLFGSFAKDADFSDANLRNADLESVDFEGTVDAVASRPDLFVRALISCV